MKPFPMLVLVSAVTRRNVAGSGVYQRKASSYGEPVCGAATSAAENENEVVNGERVRRQARHFIEQSVLCCKLGQVRDLSCSPLTRRAVLCGSELSPYTV